MDQRNAENRQLSEQQFAVLSSAFFPRRPAGVSLKEDLSCK
jgi:hypothetical protein